MIKNKLFIGLFSLSLCTSCSEDILPVNKVETEMSQVKMQLVIRDASTDESVLVENKVNSVDILSFSRKQGTTDYIFETRLENMIPTINGEHSEVVMLLTGSLPRIFYYVANGTKNIPFLSTISTGTTSAVFEAKAILLDSSIPQAPFTLVAKVEKEQPQVADRIEVELSHVVSRLDLVNKYDGFVVDSFVVNSAVMGASLFQTTTPSASDVPRKNINYNKATTIYLHQTDESTLAVHGKYKGTRAVFDIQLRNIKAATRYKVTFRGSSDATVDFTSKILFDVNPWDSGSNVESTPDWSL